MTPDATGRPPPGSESRDANLRRGRGRGIRLHEKRDLLAHHRLTMARMDRLYGVTMAEKGISQLVSVDLQESFDFLEEAA